MTTLDLTILSIALRLEQELHKQLCHSKWSRDRRHRINKRQRERDAVHGKAAALRAELA